MERDLVVLAIDGDHDAFSTLVSRRIGRLYAVARLILHGDSAAEDATQEALVAAWRDLSALRDPDRFDAWLHRLLVRACYREARRERGRRTVEVHVQPIEPAEPDSTAGVADRDQLERGFGRLDAEARTILVLHYYLGLSAADAAEVLAIPPGTARSRLFRATEAMKSALAADTRFGLAEGQA